MTLESKLALVGTIIFSMLMAGVVVFFFSAVTVSMVESNRDCIEKLEKQVGIHDAMYTTQTQSTTSALRMQRQQKGKLADLSRRVQVLESQVDNYKRSLAKNFKQNDGDFLESNRRLHEFERQMETVQKQLSARLVQESDASTFDAGKLKKPRKTRSTYRSAPAKKGGR